MVDWEEGLCIDARFTLGQKLGRAEATVWRGTDMSSGAAVVIVEHSAVGDQDARKREAAVASNMTCEHHVPVLGIGEWDGRTYVVAEDVHGEPVEQVARTCKGQMLDEDTIVEVARDVLQGLAAAEEVGLVHGDVCGTTVFVCSDNRARVLYLAQARATVATREDALASHHAPEQVLGRTIDHRTDIWALGNLMRKLSRGSLSPAVAKVVTRAMEHNPASRFHSAQEMLAALPAPQPGSLPSTRAAAGGALPAPAPPAPASPPPAPPLPDAAWPRNAGMGSRPPAERRAYSISSEQTSPGQNGSSAQRAPVDSFVIHPPLPPTMTAHRFNSGTLVSSPPVPLLKHHGHQRASGGQQASGPPPRGSLGLAITREDPPHRVVEVLALCDSNGVAQGQPGCLNAAVLPGDAIVKVDNAPVEHLPFSQVAALLSGPAQSLVDMEFSRLDTWTGGYQRIAITALRHLAHASPALLPPSYSSAQRPAARESNPLGAYGAPSGVVDARRATPQGYGAPDGGALSRSGAPVLQMRGVSAGGWDEPPSSFTPPFQDPFPGTFASGAVGGDADSWDWGHRFGVPISGGGGKGGGGQNIELRVVPGQDGARYPPGVFGSITAALRAAPSGATITVEKGMYVESLEIFNPVTLRAAAGAHVVVSSSGGVPALVVRCEDATLIGLTLTQRGGDASLRGRNTVRCVSVLSGHAVLSQCTVNSDKGVGIAVLDTATADVAQCALQGSGKCGALAMDAASLNLSGCVVTDNRMYGVVAQAASLSLVRCEVVRNGGVGVLVHRPGAEAVLEECVVTEHSEMGVAVQDGAQAKLDRVELLRNRHAGVYGDGPRSWLSIWRCTVDGSGVRGVGVQGGASIEVAECKIVNNAQEGIFVSGRGSRLMLRGGEVRRNGRGVVGQTKAFLMISGAEITNNTEGGVLVSDAETLVSLTGSNISHNLRGIGVQLGATAEVQGNRIEGNGAEGVYVSRAGSRALLVRNQIMGNGVKGVGVQHGAAAVMESNEVAGNALVGVHVDGQGSSAILRFNTMVAHPRAVVAEDGGMLRTVANRIEDGEPVPASPARGGTLSLGADGPSGNAARSPGVDGYSSGGEGGRGESWGAGQAGSMMTPRTGSRTMDGAQQGARQAMRLAQAGGAPLTPRTAATEKVLRALPGERAAEHLPLPSAQEDVRVETPRALRFQQTLTPRAPGGGAPSPVALSTLSSTPVLDTVGLGVGGVGLSVHREEEGEAEEEADDGAAGGGRGGTPPRPVRPFAGGAQRKPVIVQPGLGRLLEAGGTGTPGVGGAFARPAGIPKLRLGAILDAVVDGKDGRLAAKREEQEARPLGELEEVPRPGGGFVAVAVSSPPRAVSTHTDGREGPFPGQAREHGPVGTAGAEASRAAPEAARSSNGKRAHQEAGQEGMAPSAAHATHAASERGEAVGGGEGAEGGAGGTGRAAGDRMKDWLLMPTNMNTPRTTTSTLPKTPDDCLPLSADGTEPEGRGGPLPPAMAPAPVVSPVPLFDENGGGREAGGGAGREGGEGDDGVGWPLGDWRSRIGIH